MRLRVERFIQTRLRSMMMPATLGLGMALGGCNSDGLNADDGGNPDVVANADTLSATGGTVGTGGAIGTGGAQGSGGAPGTGGAIGTGGAQGSGGAPSTGGNTGTVHSSGGTTGSGGSISTAAKYIAPVPVYTAVFPDAGPEVSMPAPEYIAPVVKLDAGIAVRYMAQMPDARDPGPVALYLAQVPSK